MRLLRNTSGDGLILTEDFTSEDEIPPYAILSHTWKEGEEVTFDELLNGTGKSKMGYEKIKLCGQQAKLDNLQYFWVDTCCIDKSQPLELRDAINSMFRWYQNAAKCYVYLSDVSTFEQRANDEVSGFDWGPAFRSSRWFTRGFTLQELLAPTSVEFYSQEWKRLGDKESLTQEIQRITGIPESALQGAPLSQFSVNERLSWKDNRHTKLEEDKAYSLLGIFGVYINPLYGEGAIEAFRRLLCEVEKLEKCIQDLHLTDPRDDKKRIEETKGGLLNDSYRWVLTNSDFQEWRNEPHSRLLWIKGDPGKGKTMLLCGLINEMEKSLARTDLLSYFFFQATDSRINHATAVLRGLVYMLILQQPSLISHIRRKHDHAGKAVFEDANAWVALSEMFTNMLNDPTLQHTYLLIDALDECMTDLPKLLAFIVQRCTSSFRVKWIVSSRNLPEIEEQLARAEHGVRLNLELNMQSVSVAVELYIQHKVAQLSERRRYNDKLRGAVLDHLSSNAQDTFLWVALVCQTLEEVSKRNVLAKLNTFPPGLDALYERMIKQINSLDDASLCKQILALTATVYQPITLQELIAFARQIDTEADDPDSIIEVIGLCNSFLTLRDNTIYFVHQSAKEFLCTKASHDIFPSGREDTHRVLFSSSLCVMSSAALHRDMYDLRKFDYPIGDVQQPVPDPLASLHYSCIYWVDHLCDCNLDSMPNAQKHLRKGGTIDIFLSTKYLYWLEALSLYRNTSKGVISMAKLASLAKGRTDEFAFKELICDAHRFIMYHKVPIENYPLQTYVSALLFSPTQSRIRQLFKKEAPTWVKIMPSMQMEWNACLQTFEDHGGSVVSVVFSHDSSQLASASINGVKIWDVASGQCLQTLSAHDPYINSIAFSHNSEQLATVSLDGIVRVWGAIDGKCLYSPTVPETLQVPRYSRSSVMFSHNSAQLVSAFFSELAIWDVSKENGLRILKGHSNVIHSVSFSNDSKRLASASADKSVKIWDADSSKCLKTLKCNSACYTVAFFYDLTRLISSSDIEIVIWDWSSGERLQVFSEGAKSLTLSYNSGRLASALNGPAVRILDILTGECLQVLEGHNDDVNSVSLNHDSTHLASASNDGTIKIWDLSRGHVSQKHDGYSSSVPYETVLSHDSSQLAIVGRAKNIEIWDVRNAIYVHTLESHNEHVNSVSFSPDSTQLASALNDGTVKLWNLATGQCIRTFDGHHSPVLSTIFSPSSTQLASVSLANTCNVWDIHTGECLQTFEYSCGRNYHQGFTIAYSHDSTQLAVISDQKIVTIWDTRIGELTQTYKFSERRGDISSIAFAKKSNRLAIASIFGTVKLWDLDNGECLHSFASVDIVRQMSFDITESCLRTDVGTFSSNALSLFSPTHVSLSKFWIKYNSEGVLWLPSEFRADYGLFNVAEKAISIIDGSGRLWIYTFDLDQLSIAQEHWR